MSAPDLRAAAEAALAELRYVSSRNPDRVRADVIQGLAAALAVRAEAECGCSLRGRLVGDGCAICNPEYALTADACIWTEDEDGIYETACGETFIFTDGTPKDHHARFCMFCGKALEDARRATTKGATDG